MLALAMEASVRNGGPDPNKLPAQEYINQCTHIIAKENPKVAVRLVFRSCQLPSGPREREQYMWHFRNKYYIETFLSPHERENRIMPQDDVVLTMSGALDSVLDAARELLDDQAPKPRGFFMWKVCVLAPRRMHYLLVGEWDPALVYDENEDMAESSIPELRRVLGRRYGPGSTEEILVTLESPRLDHIVDALRIVAATQEVYKRAYDPFRIKLYGGGRESRIPTTLSSHAAVFQRAGKMHPDVPVGYLVRAEMQSRQQMMEPYRFHLQLMLSSDMVQSVIGLRGARIKDICQSTQAQLCISPNRLCNIRCCDICARNHERIIAAAMAVLRLLIDKGLGGWQLRVYIPQRVSQVLGDPATKLDLKRSKARIEIQTLEQAENYTRQRERLQPSETEFVATVTSDSDAVGLKCALSRILSTMYRD
ncbi:hypothetical protein BG006_000978 [Podila minutissima]|uniref:K Homology domain-containing protein n=1 Tax=Podila minutissima TaxID=64525 RepID=A0A9P5SSH0_9FUNG|nr:hypothetical protein BG006_000978 [Podila minutissima]